MPRFLSTLCLVLVVTASAAADPAAEQLFRDGRQLLKDGKIDQACDKFEQSRAVEPKPGTSLNLADCRERQGKLATAWELFLETKALAERQSDKAVAGAAVARAAAIEGKRAFLTVAVAADHRVPGLNVTRNGADVPAATWDQALPIDPGSYVIEAKATGYEPASVKVEVAAAAREIATVPALIERTTPEPPERIDRNQMRPPPPPPRISPPIRTGALGVALGGTTNGDLMSGLRLVVGLRAIAQVEAGPGALRVVMTFLYNRRYNDPSYSSDNSNGYTFGLGGDYLLAWKPGFASALGIGIGVDVWEGGDFPTSTNFRKSLRASPIIVRFHQREIELGLHAVLLVQDSPVLITTAGVDWFLW